MIFHTESGSTYEVDIDNKLIRRLGGNGPSTARFGKDGNWRKYSELLPDMLAVGKSAMIVWEIEIDGEHFVAKSTQTSPIVKFGDSPENLS